jgi:hypothetical protein
VLGIPERSALPRCVRSIQWIRSDRWVVAGSWGPLSSVVSRSGGGDKHADESPSRRRGPRALVSISVSPIGATRAPRRGTRPRVALTLSSLADCKRERLSKPPTLAPAARLSEPRLRPPNDSATAAQSRAPRGASSIARSRGGPVREGQGPEARLGVVPLCWRVDRASVVAQRSRRYSTPWLDPRP